MTSDQGFKTRMHPLHVYFVTCMLRRFISSARSASHLVGLGLMIEHAAQSVCALVLTFEPFHLGHRNRLLFNLNAYYAQQVRKKFLSNCNFNPFFGI